MNNEIRKTENDFEVVYEKEEEEVKKLKKQQPTKEHSDGRKLS